jgi:hypothetical protein
MYVHQPPPAWSPVRPGMVLVVVVRAVSTLLSEFLRIATAIRFVLFVLFAVVAAAVVTVALMVHH